MFLINAYVSKMIWARRPEKQIFRWMLNSVRWMRIIRDKFFYLMKYNKIPQTRKSICEFVVLSSKTFCRSCKTCRVKAWMKTVNSLEYKKYYPKKRRRKKNYIKDRYVKWKKFRFVWQWKETSHVIFFVFCYRIKRQKREKGKYCI
jgi:hypothetical protein